ncbi:5'-phosphate synthase pdxT subunit [Methanolinea mesophila]|uniref:pyridoxal 5'-phosphate synthase glutaminase subunit PdxT n=1 Tax=Methanolinea mesophila TaxID=547055 RepID=UPI001AE24C8F|nr:5'-phosphate synthase pdxT subunit [Methanolinea mesophila]
MDVKIGVLALQGNVSEHIRAFEGALQEMGFPGERVVPLRNADQIPDLDAIAIPGGESTTISRLIDKNGMYTPLTEFGGGIFATCAGMVIIAREVDDPRVHPLGLIGIGVQRNAFGRQKESFETDLPVKGLEFPFHAVFIRAPVAVSHDPGVDVLARIDAGIVAVTSGKHMALAFHPELGTDYRLHRLFLENLGIF